MEEETINTVFFIVLAIVMIAALIAIFYLYAGKGVRIVI